jgi:hypothetical protein
MNVSVAGNVMVGQNATLIDEGAQVQQGIQATKPNGIGIGGSPTGAGGVAQNISVNGATGSASGGHNYLCNTAIGQGVTVTATAAGAGTWIIGDQDESCTNGPIHVAQNLSVTNNAVRVDVSDNRFGKFPYTVGIGQNLYVTGNTVSAPVVEHNFIAGSATCQANTTTDSDRGPDNGHNTVEGTNSGCP